MLNKIGSLLIILPFLTLFISCNGGEMPEHKIQFPSIKDIPASKWEKLAQKKIYFGHMSVGYNILDGVRDIMKENSQVKLNIVETTDKANFKEALFAHSKVGKNRDPQSKIDAFKGFLEGGIGENADIAFLKCCYLDFMPDTDVQKVFSEYRDAMSHLKMEYPEIAFIHVTVPLTARQSGIKAWIKKLIGRPVRGVDDNIKRNQFNELLRQEYDGKGPIFDLEKIESTYPDGRRMLFEKDGKNYYSMVPEYTHDGGHLNETGRRKVAEQLLILLSNLSQ